MTLAPEVNRTPLRLSRFGGDPAGRARRLTEDFALGAAVRCVRVTGGRRVWRVFGNRRHACLAVRRSPRVVFFRLPHRLRGAATMKVGISHGLP